MKTEYKPSFRTKAVLILAAVPAALLAAACSSPAPTPTPVPPSATPAPSPTPAPTATAVQRALTVTPTPSTDSVIQYTTAYAYLSRGDFAEAERYFTTVIELEPEFARGWDGRGQARLFKGDYEDALLDFDQAIALKPSLAQAYSHRAFARMTTRDMAGARRDAEKALSFNEDLIDAHIVLGRVYAAAGQNQEALNSFDRAVALAPKEGGVYWWRGRFYRDALGDYQRALDDFDRAIEFDPAQASLFLDRAVLLLTVQAPLDLVKKDLEEAVSLAQEPKLPDILDQAEPLLALVDEAIRTGKTLAPR